MVARHKGMSTMLEIVSRGFQNAKAALTGRTTLTAENIDSAVREIRVSLLEADVELGVVKRFLGRVKERALGEVVTLSTAGGANKKQSRSPGDHFVYICHKELETLMGTEERAPIAFRRPITTIMMVGLQGVGKTTTCGKLARALRAERRKPLLVAADIQRPAAVKQLQVLGERIGVPVFFEEGLSPEAMCLEGLAHARREKLDIVILDTAGRLAIDAPLMDELTRIKASIRPDNTFLVVDAMAGQDTVTTARAFNEALDVSGFVLTKLDGDARGGAALSLRELTGKPIKYLGMGEGMKALEPFRPEGLASRILGMGDIVGLMKDFEQVVDGKQAERDAKKMLRGRFTFEDFLGQLETLQKVGSVKDIMAKLPMFGGMGQAAAGVDDKLFVGMKAMIQSMTPKERENPKLIDAKRQARIARGSGKKESDVKQLLERFGMMQTMMQGLARQPGLMGMMPGMGKLAGGLGALKKMRGQSPSDLMRNIDPKMLAQLEKQMPSGGLPGMPGMPKMPGLPGMPSGRPSGQTPLAGGEATDAAPDFEQLMAMQKAMGQGPRAQSSTRDRARAKDKRKQAKQARKKARR